MTPDLPAPALKPLPIASRYAITIDRNLAAVEGRGRGASLVPIVVHEAFRRRRRYSKAETVQLAIKQAALRIISGLEDRSLRDIARDIGCSHQAIDNAIARMADYCRMKKFYVPGSKREERSARRRDAARIVELKAEPARPAHPR